MSNQQDSESRGLVYSGPIISARALQALATEVQGSWVSVEYLRRIAALEDADLDAEQLASELLEGGVPAQAIARQLYRSMGLDWRNVGEAAEAALVLAMGDPHAHTEGGAPGVVRELLRAIAEELEPERARRAAAEALDALRAMRTDLSVLTGDAGRPESYFAAAHLSGIRPERLLEVTEQIIAAVEADAGEHPRVAAAVAEARRRTEPSDEYEEYGDPLHVDFAGAVLAALCQAYGNLRGTPEPSPLFAERDACVDRVAVPILRRALPEVAAVVDRHAAEADRAADPDPACECLQDVGMGPEPDCSEHGPAPTAEELDAADARVSGDVVDRIPARSLRALVREGIGPAYRSEGLELIAALDGLDVDAGAAALEAVERGASRLEIARAIHQAAADALDPVDADPAGLLGLLHLAFDAADDGRWCGTLDQDLARNVGLDHARELAALMLEAIRAVGAPRVR